MCGLVWWIHAPNSFVDYSLKTASVNGISALLEMKAKFDIFVTWPQQPARIIYLSYPWVCQTSAARRSCSFLLGTSSSLRMSPTYQVCPEMWCNQIVPKCQGSCNRSRKWSHVSSLRAGAFLKWLLHHGVFKIHVEFPFFFLFETCYWILCSDRLKVSSPQAPQ